MIGVLVNVATIVIGGFIGLLIKGRFNKNTTKVIMQAIGLSVLIIGVIGAIKTNNALVLVLSLVSGGIIGSLLKIDDRLEKLGKRVEERFQGDGVAKGFVMGTLLYCVGAMAIIGSLEASLQGDNTTLYIKAILDGVTAIVFASTIGYGIILSAIPVLLYQGSIVILGQWVEPLLTDTLVTEISAVGSVLIIGIAFNVLNMSKIRVGDLLPSVIMPILWIIVFQLVGVM